jgi:hypothetical protein
MNYKLKHLAKYCCRPANELEFEAVKMAAKIGGVKWSKNECRYDKSAIRLNAANCLRRDLLKSCKAHFYNEISVLDFIKKLRMTEEEARELEDDSVAFGNGNKHKWAWSDDDKRFIALEGYYFKTNEDGTEVTLHKKKK